MTGSLAFRKNRATILSGKVPAKYTRILPHIPEGKVLELGSAEGVLACLLAREGRKVTALEMNAERHTDAIALCKHWRSLFGFKGGPKFVRGNIADRLDLLDGTDVLVAVRMVYYLRNQIDEIFAEIAKKVPTVVLCGNRNRADAWRRGKAHEPLGEFNRYAAREGMTELLTRHGYTITSELTDGDEIVVGTMVRSESDPVQDQPSDGPAIELGPVEPAPAGDDDQAPGDI